MADTFEDVLARLEKLEAHTLALRDLPLAALQRRLEQDWQPQASLLLGENSITEEMLADAIVVEAALADGAVTEAKLGDDVLRIVRGVVSSTGTIVEGTGFSAAQTGTGAYTITLDEDFSDVPAVTVTAQTGGALAGRTGTVTAGSFTVGTFTTTTGAAGSVQFHFIAIGPR